MTYKEITDIALRQSAEDLGCCPQDFLKSENVVVISRENPRARKYLELPFECDLVSYGTNIVASVSAELAEAVKNYINSYPAEHCFETPNIHVLDNILQKHGLKTCFMAEYFLPDPKRIPRLECGYDIRLLSKEDFGGLYRPEWSNALCEKRKHLDVLAVGVYDKDRLIGLAGASADCEDMWQIGIDVLPEYRRRGIACTLTSSLAAEILKRGKVPFYCAAWSNIKSVRNALKSGFYPAWAELTAKSCEFIEKMNKIQ